MIRPDPEKETEIIEKVRKGELDLKQAFREFDKLDSQAGLDQFVLEEHKPASARLAFITRMITRIKQVFRKTKSLPEKDRDHKQD